MTNLPTHPRTGLTAIGTRRDGRPIWPVMGGDGTTPPPEPTPQPASSPAPEPAPAAPPPPPPGLVPAPEPAPAAPPPPPPGLVPATGQPAPPEPKSTDEPLGEGGKKALDAERELRKAAETAAKAQAEQMAELKKQLEALQPAADIFAQLRKAAVPEAEKTDTERLQDELTQLRQTAETERVERFRAEVAAEKGLTREQARRLVGQTREELVADADALLALFPQAPAPPAVPTPGDPAGNGQPQPNGQPPPAAPPAVPKPDPSQGARGSVDLHAQIQDALAKGDVRTSIALKQQLRAAQTTQ